MPIPTYDLLVDKVLLHSHKSGDITDLATILDSRYLLLDQTTPQTTTGTFGFSYVLLGNSPTLDMHAATKVYVDSVRDIDGGTFFDTYISVNNVDAGGF